MTIKKTTLHPENDSEIELYPKTSVDQVTGLLEYIEQQVNTIFNTMHDINAVWTLRNAFNIAPDKGIFYYSNSGAAQSILYEDVKNLKALSAVGSLNGTGLFSYNTQLGIFGYYSASTEPNSNTIAIRSLQGTLTTAMAIQDNECVNLGQVNAIVQSQTDGTQNLHHYYANLSGNTVNTTYMIYIDLGFKNSDIDLNNFGGLDFAGKFNALKSLVEVGVAAYHISIIDGDSIRGWGSFYIGFSGVGNIIGQYYDSANVLTNLLTVLTSDELTSPYKVFYIGRY